MEAIHRLLIQMGMAPLTVKMNVMLTQIRRYLDSVAAVVERNEVSRISDAERAIDEDATVREIKQKFGAKIVPDSVQPLQ